MKTETDEINEFIMILMTIVHHSTSIKITFKKKATTCHCFGEINEESLNDLVELQKKKKRHHRKQYLGYLENIMRSINLAIT